MDVNLFKEISMRGRVAYAIVCLEEVLKKQNIRQIDEIEKTIVQQLWHYTSDNLGLWEIQVLEITPFAVCDEVAYDIKDYDFISMKFHDRLQVYYKGCFDYTLRIIDLIFNLGRTHLFVHLTTEKLQNEPLPYLQSIIDLLEQNNIVLPDIKPFQKSSITEDHGWGKTFTRDELFR